VRGLSRDLGTDHRQRTLGAGAITEAASFRHPSSQSTQGTRSISANRTYLLRILRQPHPSPLEEGYKVGNLSLHGLGHRWWLQWGVNRCPSRRVHGYLRLPGPGEVFAGKGCRADCFSAAGSKSSLGSSIPERTPPLACSCHQACGGGVLAHHRAEGAQRDPYQAG
jgi:hypothetical protein